MNVEGRFTIYRLQLPIFSTFVLSKFSGFVIICFKFWQLSFDIRIHFIYRFESL